MVYLNNENKSGTFLKNKNSFSGDERINLVGLVEGFASFLVLIGAMMLFLALSKTIKHAMCGHDSDNPAEEVPLQQEMMNMNGNIPNNQNNNIEIPLMAENGEAGF